MTSHEKLILRFLLTVLAVGLVVGFIRRTWFSPSLETLVDPEAMAAKVAAAAENTRARHLKLGRMDTSVETGEKINLNNAPKYQLMLLPGVGPALAERILIYREDHGDFESIEELARVKGIGEKTVQGLREWVTVEDQNQKDFEEE